MSSHGRSCFVARAPRNDRWVDYWSWTHFAWGMLLGWIMPPFWALTLLILWEPLEIFILSPLAYRRLGKEFGHETLRNSLSDVMFDAAGVAAGALLLRAIAAPPFFLFG
jgi:hypothetical protein